jgi:nucleoside-triphosphatase
MGMKHPGRILIITGERGVGKTTLCQEVIRIARQVSWQVKGLISPAVVENGKKIAISVENLSSGEQHRLAQPINGQAEGVHTESWQFYQVVLEWSNQVLVLSSPCDLLVVDELGPLELQRGEGWQAGLTILDRGTYRLALVVVRKELLDLALARFPSALVMKVDDVQAVTCLVEEIRLGYLTALP